MHLSVIIPVYNAAATLDRCLQSISAQKMADYEVLLVDDGSKDDSGIICDGWAGKDPRFKVIHQANAGASAARNTALAKAQGEWICFIDADDTIEGDYFPLQFDDGVDMYLQNEQKGETDLYQKLHVPADGEMLSMKEFLLKYAHTNLFRGICSKFCKRSLIQQNKIGFDVRQRIGEDTLFFLQYVQLGSVVQLLTGGKYIYYTDTGWIQKYHFSREEAYRFFEAFVPLYEQLPVPSPRLASNIFSTLQELANKGEKIPLSWKLHPSVLKIKYLQFPIRNWRFRIRCRLARLLGLFCNHH